ncbi:MAG: MBL fold metallo-hydrolase [Caulobacteraceae bacterium]|nr:MBL fold metallo-hydrolase [Caulobacteraceae bacterium]
MNGHLRITRVVNACVLLQFGDEAVLTDPFMSKHRWIRFNEPIGLSASDLPRLAAILGGHGVFDHWWPASLATYRHKSETPCYVATRGMARSGGSAGFANIEVVGWGARRAPSAGLSLEVVCAGRRLGWRANSYVIASPAARVFIGTEALELAPLRHYGMTHQPVDVALLPIDGAAVVGKRLVMTLEEAIEGARVLGAKTLVPIHYSLKPFGPLTARIDPLPRSLEADGLKVLRLATGSPWDWG